MSKFTHAGGLVLKRDGDRYLYLIVRAKEDTTEWVFPKGHIESGEDSRETAIREVREEAGVEAKLLSRIGSIAFQHKGEEIHVDFYLLEYIRKVPREEIREVRWCSYVEAMTLLSFQDTKQLLGLAQEIVQKHFYSR